MEELFPTISSKEDLIYSILSQGSLDQISEGGEYHCVLRFATELKQLQIGGELLPDLIELYKWIHSDLSQRITRQRATKITMDEVLCIAIKHSSDDAGDHLKKLYEKITRNCKQYQNAEASSTTESINLKRTKKIKFNNSTPLLHLLSDTENEGQGKDYLYQLITEILTDHNDTINRFFKAAKQHNLLLLPDTLLEVHPTDVTSDCVIISNAKDIDLFQALLRSRYIPSYTSMKCKTVGSHVRRDISYFELDKLEEDIISNFIRGKPLIKSTVTFRTVFKFRKEDTSKDSAELQRI